MATILKDIIYNGNTGNYKFDGGISREVLENYLSRAIMFEYLWESEQYDEDIRCINNMGAKLISRAATDWGGPLNESDGTYWSKAKKMVTDLHESDPDIIVHVAILECMNRSADWPEVPAWVFEEFGQPIEKRKFSYDAMLFPDGWRVDHWHKDSSVPDITRIESQMWFYYRATQYIDAGFEGFHLGQMSLMGERDPSYKTWDDVIRRIREYASKHARRHYILIDASPVVAREYPGIDGRLLLDYIIYPQRPREDLNEPQKAYLEMGWADTMYGISPGGLHPSGWTCEHVPYLLDFDHWGATGKEGQPCKEPWTTWGYDETDWYAHQSEEYRNEYLHYVTNWLKENDPNGHLVAPGRDVLAVYLYPGDRFYRVNTRSAASPHGSNQEETMKAIWEQDVAKDEA
ncbi:MAG: hypothetical protein ABFD54_09035 [Armatimonadota bacterium]|nr:hypothetical protein [bacterium]